jgi:hypothetical protein
MRLQKLIGLTTTAESQKLEPSARMKKGKEKASKHQGEERQ